MDTVSPATRTRMMSAVRGKDTKPERVVRAMLWAMGHRYRLQARDLPGRPDIVFRGRRAAVFVHGCFWHAHGAARCPGARMPKSNTAFWRAKLDANTARDARAKAALKAMGWRVMTVWECRLKTEAGRAATGRALAKFLAAAR